MSHLCTRFFHWAWKKRVDRIVLLLISALTPSCDFDHTPSEVKGVSTESQGVLAEPEELPPENADDSTSLIDTNEPVGSSEAPTDSDAKDGNNRDHVLADRDTTSKESTDSIDASIDSATVPPLDSSSALESFGLICDSIMCSSVTHPCQQCCTTESDVDEQRATELDRCGISYRADSGCIELEQMGVLDDSCPSFTPSWSMTEEPGCCTIEGQCGTFSVEESIGCHKNQGIEKSCGKEQIDDTSDCEPTGIFAVKAEVDVVWGGQSGALFDITDDGRGKINIILKVTIPEVEADNTAVSTVEPCRVEIPHFTNSLLCESYAPTFPDEIWDEGNIPEISLKSTFNCLHPGCTLSFEPITVPIGIELEDLDSSWPTAEEATSFPCEEGTGSDCYPDADGDGYPGITLVLPHGTEPSDGICREFSMESAPLDADIAAIVDGVYRTNRLHVGIRVRMGLSAEFADDCNIIESISFAEFFQSRAASCMLEPGSRDLFSLPARDNDFCTDAQLLFMNDAFPIYEILGFGQLPSPLLDLPDRSISEGPHFELIRLSDLDQDISCEDVRKSF